MKFLRISSISSGCIKDFYFKNPGLSGKSYAEQKTKIDYQAFEWSDYWANALTPLGYDVSEVISNAEPLQRAWARENALPDPASVKLEEIVFHQAETIRPEILFYENQSKELLQRIRSNIPSVRLVLGWVGSAVSGKNLWSLMDLVLSCAKESVDFLHKSGYASEQLHHGFDPRINGRLVPGSKNIPFSFIGQLIRSEQFHLERDRLLEKIAREAGITIFSPSRNLGWRETGKAMLMMGCYDVLDALGSLGVSESTRKNLPVVGPAAQWRFRPVLPINPKLKPYMKAPVFGLEMFQVLRDSCINLNIHADSSPEYASNMRLFETTGVGTCLITDWKKNLHRLFDLDSEVVAYKSADECVEKVKWLQDHPEKREEIGLAGQKRTLKDHTYLQRAEQLHNMILSKLRK